MAFKQSKVPVTSYKMVKEQWSANTLNKTDQNSNFKQTVNQRNQSIYFCGWNLEIK